MRAAARFDTLPMLVYVSSGTYDYAAFLRSMRFSSLLKYLLFLPPSLLSNIPTVSFNDDFFRLNGVVSSSLVLSSSYSSVGLSRAEMRFSSLTLLNFSGEGGASLVVRGPPLDGE